jgi:hypothetical protein
MRPANDRPAQRFDRVRGANISHKLHKIVTDIEKCGHAFSARDN